MISTAEYVDKILHEWVEAGPLWIERAGVQQTLHSGNACENWHCFQVGDVIYPYKLSLSDAMYPFGWSIIDTHAAVATLAMWAERNGMTYLGKRTLQPAKRFHDGGYYVKHHTVRVEHNPAAPLIVGGYYEQYEMTIGTVKIDRRYLIGV